MDSGHNSVLVIKRLFPNYRTLGRCLKVIF